MNTTFKKKHLILWSKVECIMWYKEYEFGIQIHFHKLCEPTLNFTFFPWKEEAPIMTFNPKFFTVIDWVKQKSL